MFCKCWRCAKKNGKRTTPDNNIGFASSMKHNIIISQCKLYYYTGIPILLLRRRAVYGITTRGLINWMFVTVRRNIIIIYNIECQLFPVENIITSSSSILKNVVKYNNNNDIVFYKILITIINNSLLLLLVTLGDRATVICRGWSQDWTTGVYYNSIIT